MSDFANRFRTFVQAIYICCAMRKVNYTSLKPWKILIQVCFFCILLSSCGVNKLCPIPSCQVRMLHAHGGITYRGQPWWRVKRQNPKVGQQYVYTKDKNLIKSGNWFTRTFGKKPEKKAGDEDFGDIKARDPHDKNGSKDFDTEEPEEDKEDNKEKEGE
jgi:hypothetical protein